MTNNSFEMVTNACFSGPYKVDRYEDFLLWSSMPSVERKKLGIETQADFVEAHKLGINTPTRWKKRVDFSSRVTALRKEWGFEKTSDVIDGIYQSAIGGNPNSQKLWLQYFLDFNTKSSPTNTPDSKTGVNDIRFLIEMLPEPQKTKHYTNLRKLLDDASATYRMRDKDDVTWTTIPAMADLSLVL